MRRYIALFEYEEGKSGYSIVFPDVPGCYSAGDTYEEAFEMAHEALAFHLEDEEEIPTPRTLEQIKKEWEDWNEWEKDGNFVIGFVSLHPENIVFDERLLDRIDAITKNRSEFITQAVEKVLDNI